MVGKKAQTDVSNVAGSDINKLSLTHVDSW